MTFTIPIDVRFADLDALGHVNSTRILAYAEHARVRWMLASGFAPSPDRLPIILAAAHADYKAPIHHDATVEVAMTTPRVGTKSWDWDYAVRDALDGTLYASVRTVQVAYDYAAAASRPVTDHERRLLLSLAPGA